MNLLLYFCVPLVVTGQVVSEKGQRQKDVDNQEASETELYSKHEYGSHVGYKISPINEFAIENGEYYRKPGIEDNGAVGVPNIYNSASAGGGGGNNDHPSFITSDIYNSIKGKKNNNDGNTHTQPSSPLAYGAPSSSHHNQNEITESHQHNQSPVLQQLTAGHSVLYQDPHTGQLIQGSTLKNGEVPLYPSPVAPQVEYGVPQPQQVAPIPTLRAINSPVYQHQTPAISVYEAHSNHKSAEEHNHHNTLLKTPVAPAYQHQLLKTSDDTVFQGPDGQLYQHQLLKTPDGTVLQAPAFQPQLFKTADGVLYQKQVSPAHQPQLFKSPEGVLYQKQVSPAHPPQLFKSPEGVLYQKQVSLAHPPQLFKSPEGVLYQKQVSPAYQLVKTPEGVVYQAPVAQAYEHQILNTPEKLLYKTPDNPTYEHQLLKNSDEVVYKTPHAPAYQLVKTPEKVAYQTPIVPTYEHQLLKTPEGVVYKQPVHQPEVAPVYSAPVSTHENVLLKTDPTHSHHHHPSFLKTALYHQALYHQHHDNPVFLKSADGTIYQAQNQYVNVKTAPNPLLVHSPIYQTKEPIPERFLLKDATIPLYKQPTLNDVTAHKLLKTTSIPVLQDTPGVIHQHFLKTAVRPLFKAPLLKTSGLGASIVPAIEEHYPQLQHVHPSQLLVKAPLQQLTQYLAPGTPNVSPVYQQLLFQKAILHKQPALIEKAVIKEALLPVHTRAVHDSHSHDPIVRDPILPSHYVRARLPPDHPDLPARILTSHKPLVNSLISSGRFRGGGRDTNVELVPSKSYGYSYSLYPNTRGLYSRPTKPLKH